jgi:perosamine synthetase
MIPVNTPLMDGNEKRYLAECIDTGWISSEGPFVTRLEKEFAALCGRKHGVAVCNGTAALQIAVEALDLPPGSEVILPSFTIMSCAFPLARLGLKPVLVDCDPVTFNASPSDYAAAVTERTSAIMIVHLYGLPVDMQPILDLAARKGLKVIEDAAELIGARYRDGVCGGFGDVSTVSFYPNKHITTGEGGMVLANDPAIDARLRSLRNLSFDPGRRFLHHELGWNYRMTNLQAAIGCAQMEKVQRNIRLKHEIGARYNAAFAGLKGARLPAPDAPFGENIYWVYSLVLDDDVPIDAAEMMRLLAARGIGTRPFFWPLHEQPVLREMYPELRAVSLPHASRVARRGFYLPSGLGLDLDLIPQVANTVKDVLRAL